MSDEESISSDDSGCMLSPEQMVSQLSQDEVSRIVRESLPVLDIPELIERDVMDAIASLPLDWEDDARSSVPSESDVLSSASLDHVRILTQGVQQLQLYDAVDDDGNPMFEQCRLENVILTARVTVLERDVVDSGISVDGRFNSVEAEIEKLEENVVRQESTSEKYCGVLTNILVDQAKAISKLEESFRQQCESWLDFRRQLFGFDAKSQENVLHRLEKVEELVKHGFQDAVGHLNIVHRLENVEKATEDVNHITTGQHVIQHRLKYVEKCAENAAIGQQDIFHRLENVEKVTEVAVQVAITQREIIGRLEHIDELAGDVAHAAAGQKHIVHRLGVVEKSAEGVADAIVQQYNILHRLGKVENSAKASADAIANLPDVVRRLGQVEESTEVAADAAVKQHDIVQRLVEVEKSTPAVTEAIVKQHDVFSRLEEVEKSAKATADAVTKQHVILYRLEEMEKSDEATADAVARQNGIIRRLDQIELAAEENIKQITDFAHEYQTQLSHGVFPRLDNVEERAVVTEARMSDEIIPRLEKVERFAGQLVSSPADDFAKLFAEHAAPLRAQISVYLIERLKKVETTAEHLAKVQDGHTSQSDSLKLLHQVVHTLSAGLDIQDRRISDLEVSQTSLKHWQEAWFDNLQSSETAVFQHVSELGCQDLRMNMLGVGQTGLVKGQMAQFDSLHSLQEAIAQQSSNLDIQGRRTIALEADQRNSSEAHKTATIQIECLQSLQKTVDQHSSKLDLQARRINVLEDNQKISTEPQEQSILQSEVLQSLQETVDQHSAVLKVQDQRMDVLEANQTRPTDAQESCTLQSESLRSLQNITDQHSVTLTIQGQRMNVVEYAQNRAASHADSVNDLVNGAMLAITALQNDSQVLRTNTESSETELQKIEGTIRAIVEHMRLLTDENVVSKAEYSQLKDELVALHREIKVECGQYKKEATQLSFRIKTEYGQYKEELAQFHCRIKTECGSAKKELEQGHNKAMTVSDGKYNEMVSKMNEIFARFKQEAAAASAQRAESLERKRKRKDEHSTDIPCARRRRSSNEAMESMNAPSNEPETVDRILPSIEEEDWTHDTGLDLDGEDRFTYEYPEGHLEVGATAAQNETAFSANTRVSVGPPESTTRLPRSSGEADTTSQRPTRTTEVQPQGRRIHISESVTPPATGLSHQQQRGRSRTQRVSTSANLGPKDTPRPAFVQRFVMGNRRVCASVECGRCEVHVKSSRVLTEEEKAEPWHCDLHGVIVGEEGWGRTRSFLSH